MKKLMRSFIGTVSLLSALFFNAVAQTIPADPVPVGGKVPDLAITLWTGDSMRNAHLSDFKGKLLLLDFWSTGCESCVASLPEMQKLQQEYGDRIKIIEVGGYWDDDAALKAFWKKMDGHLSRAIFDAARKMPFVKTDTMLHHLFQHEGNGWAVWIDGAGIYKGMGTGITVTAANIDAFLQGKELPLNMEARELALDPSQPLSWLPNAAGSDYSLFTNGIRQAGMGAQTTKIVDSVSGSLLGLSLVNHTIPDMYKLAYTAKYHFHKRTSSMMSDDQILPEVKDAGPLIAPGVWDAGFLEWTAKNQYCYAIRISDSISGNVYDKLISDLDNRFNYQSAIEYRKIKCLILRRIGPAHALLTKGGEPRHVLKYTGDDSVAQSVCVSCPLYMIQSDIAYLTAHNEGFKGFSTVVPYVVNETGYDLYDELDFVLPNWADIKHVTLDQIRHGLHTIGLDLVVGDRVRPVLVIRDGPQRVRAKPQISSAAASRHPIKYAVEGWGDE